MMVMFVLMLMFVAVAFVLFVMVMMLFVYHDIRHFLPQRYALPSATGLQTDYSLDYS